MISHTKICGLMMAIVLAWVGVVAQSYAFCQSTQVATQQPAATVQDIADMTGMKDCPSKQQSKPMKMEPTTCALYCYGLAPSMVLEPLPLMTQTQSMMGSRTTLASQPLLGHILGVPTPPPNLA